MLSCQKMYQLLSVVTLISLAVGCAGSPLLKQETLKPKQVVTIDGDNVSPELLERLKQEKAAPQSESSAPILRDVEATNTQQAISSATFSSPSAAPLEQQIIPAAFDTPRPEQDAAPEPELITGTRISDRVPQLAPAVDRRLIGGNASFQPTFHAKERVENAASPPGSVAALQSKQVERTEFPVSGNPRLKGVIRDSQQRQRAIIDLGALGTQIVSEGSSIGIDQAGQVRSMTVTCILQNMVQLTDQSTSEVITIR